jgi:hypothetical protein
MTTLTTKIENLRKQTCQLNLEETAAILDMTPDELKSRIWSGNFPIAPVGRWADLRINPVKLASFLEGRQPTVTNQNRLHINCPNSQS